MGLVLVPLLLTMPTTMAPRCSTPKAKVRPGSWPLGSVKKTSAVFGAATAPDDGLYRMMVVPVP